MSDVFPVSYRIRDLRQSGWKSIPDEPGVYWWFFPEPCLDELQITSHCEFTLLNLLTNENDMVALYVGAAKSLRQRTKWHADQPLTQSNLQSKYLSTFRNTLLSLTQIDYATGFKLINQFMDSLEVAWQVTSDKESAERIEAKELDGFSLPLNINTNPRPELTLYKRFLKQQRESYRETHLKKD
ncbi:MAG: hypothetical protein ACI8P0_002130 [Planctomycetaceae bacterium]|jgi:hypothetical protein